MSPEIYIFEIPIYRCSQGQFDTSYKSDLKKHFFQVWPEEGRNAVNSDIASSVEDCFWQTYGMPWQYNQIVGWIRIFILGSQVRGELWFTNAKKLSRRPAHRQITNVGKAFEILTEPTDSSEEILANVRQNILERVKGLRSGKLVVDLECFDNLASHLNWHNLIYEDNNA